MEALFFVLAAAVGASAEERLARIEEKLERIESLLSAVFGEDLKRIEELESTPGLLTAIREVEQRYRVSGIRKALAAAEPDKLFQLQANLDSAIRRTDPARLKEDGSFRMVVVEVMVRMETIGRPGGRLLTTMRRRDPALVTSLLPDLFERPDATVLAFTAACLAEGDEVADLVRAKLPFLTEPREILSACAALLAQGDEGALGKLRESLKAVRDDELIRFLATNLRQKGAPGAMWLFLELVRSEHWCRIGASEFAPLRGEKRVDPRKVRSERMKLYEEYARWLEENYSRIRFDPTRQKFFLEGGKF